MELNKLDFDLVTRMEALAGECNKAPHETGTTTLLCNPMVTYDACARYRLNAQCPRRATHDEVVTVLLDMVTEGYARVFRDGHTFYFEGRPN